jgi:membrane-associated phospholipid phosphatase
VENGWTLKPARSDVALSLRWAAFLTLLFLPVYGLCNWITAQRATRYRLWFDWELALPFVPEMVWVYLSLFASFFLPMFALRAPALNALCRRLAFAVLASAAGFLLLPAEPGFARPVGLPGSATAFQLVYLLDLPHNQLPSLHVSWSALLLAALREASGPLLRCALEVWFIALCVSVLLVYQHHVLDVIGGLLVAWAAHAAVHDDGNWAWLSGRQP